MVQYRHNERKGDDMRLKVAENFAVCKTGKGKSARYEYYDNKQGLISISRSTYYRLAKWLEGRK